MSESMSPSTVTPDDALRFRRKAFGVGCVANIILLATLAILCGIFLFAIVRTLERPSAAADEKAIRAVLTAQTTAWNRGDLDGFMEGYWKSEDLTFISGDTVTTGWEATRQRYIKRYRSERKEMGHLGFEELQIEPLNGRLALVRGRYILKRTGQAEATGRFTLVFRKIDGVWKITSDHTSAAEGPTGND